MIALCPRNAQARVAALGAGVAMAALLASCGPAPKPADAKSDAEIATAAAPAPAAASEPAVKTDPAAMLAKLKELDPGQTYVWEDAHEVIVDASPDAGKAAGKAAIRLSPTPVMTRHFVGLHVLPRAPGAVTLRVKLWLKPTPDTQVALEMAGREARSDSRPKSYANGVIDFKTMAVLDQKAAADTKLQNASIVQDGDWQVVSCTFTSSDGYFVLNIGMAADGSHLFLGGPKYGLTVGGVEITPVK